MGCTLFDLIWTNAKTYRLDCGSMYCYHSMHSTLAILAGSVVGGAIVGITRKDFDTFSNIAGVGFLICLHGLAVAVILFVLAFFVDGARVLLSLFGLDAGQDPITTQRMFFPWSM